MKPNPYLLILAMVLATPSFADEATQASIEALNDECQTNPEGCNALFGSLSATVASPTDILVGLTFSDPELSSDSWDSMAQELERARPDAAEFFQSEGQSGLTAVLADSMDKIRKVAPQYAGRSELELAELITFGGIHSQLPEA